MDEIKRDPKQVEEDEMRFASFLHEMLLKYGGKIAKRHAEQKNDNA